MIIPNGKSRAELQQQKQRIDYLFEAASDTDSNKFSRAC